MLTKLEQAKQNLDVKCSTKNPSSKTLDNFDPKILDFVVVLNCLGFSTFSSCQGHIYDKAHSRFHPFVMLCSKNVERLYFMSFVFDYRQLLITEYKAMLEDQAKIIEYLDEFYTNRNTPMKHRLIVETNIYFRITIKPHFALLSRTVKSKEEQTRLNKLYLKEIDDFTEFLKTKIS